jgi:acyl carrier protein
VPGQRVAVVDPEAAIQVAAGTEGEIWVAGPHVTPGYLTGADDELFGELDGTRYLRTGDLGVLRGEELHVTGRTKDVLVVRGENHHAVDLEAAAMSAAGRVARTAAAFLVDGPDGAPLPVVVVEVHGRRDEELAARIRAAVLTATGLRPAAVVVTAPQAVPRTSSGKVRRSACRAAYLAGDLRGAVVAGDRAGLAGLAGARTAAELATLVAGVLGAVAEADCDPDTDLAALAIDSVGAAEAAAVLEDALGLPVPLEALLGAGTPRAVAGALATAWAADGHGPDDVRTRLGRLAATDLIEVG